MRKIILGIWVLFALYFMGCKNGTKSSPNQEAALLEFTIEELPNTVFSVDEEDGLVKVTNRSSIDGEVDWTSLKASFEVSEGAKVLVQETEQVSGETVNDFSEGVFYTIISEDEATQQTYFVYLTRDLPMNYLLLEEPEVQLNPSGKNPLAALVHLKKRETISVNMDVLGDIPIEKNFILEDAQNSIPVLGLYPDTQNQVVLYIYNNDGQSARDTLIMETEPLPDFFPTPEINIVKEDQMEPGMHFNDFHIGNNGVFNSYPFIFDNNGDIRWVMDLSDVGKAVWSVHFYDNKANTLYFTHSSSIFEYDMLGNELNEINMGGHITHHEVRKIPNGNYLVAVNKDGATMIQDGQEKTSLEDFVFEVDQAGNIVKEWDMAEVLDVNRTDLVDGGQDWFHMNAIWYDSNDRGLIISGRKQGLVKVDQDNDPQWILAPHKGWGQAGRYEKTGDTEPYLLTAVNRFTGTPYNEEVQLGTEESDQFSWVWGQHAPLILPNGNLLVFDNGFNRNFGEAGSDYSLITEYEIDEENMTVSEVWSYGRERGEELFSNIISDVDFLPETGNRLFMPGVVNYGGGSYSKMVELSYPHKEVVFEATVHFKNQLANGQGWGNIDITYRGERVKLYRNEIIFSEKR
ncbi:aryl-sulfate sulfotransferase [Gracilimonas mengyeensis]|uniref:Arylsulfate sulfotransferase n=1 Tax=Gracilimonas mengyeensis TaxID=1302730 RepID=A0A521CTH1_9BACT|nr:aryl-sulfate sulfotransferase [Gracilimonas mengyeensis]SMO62031.1 arylsulfate sulfotransferase [Gracilimonas mengyeensis]